MSRLTAADLVKAIKQLPLNTPLEYPSGGNKLEIVSITEPDGPIKYRIHSNITERKSISSNQLARMASGLKANFPVHIDVLFECGGNTRSALETLLCHTPYFFLCYPGRVDNYTGEILEGTKHIMWCPDDYHPLSEITYRDYTGVVSELQTAYDDIHISADMLTDEFENIEAKRTHTRMQIALAEIGYSLGLKTWIAKNDQNILYGNGRLSDLPGVIKSLDEIRLFPNQDVKDAAEYIDCIWVSEDDGNIPAVFEIEHSTGVNSGLVRMNTLKTAFKLLTGFVVVAPDSLRTQVVSKANNRQFKHLNTKFMTYTAVQHLYGLVQNYNIKKIGDYNFALAFMDEIIGT